MERLSKCDLCEESYKVRTPKILFCGHTFFLQCLSKVAKEGKVNCPNCLVDSNVPKDGVDSLPTNYKLMSFVHYMEDKKVHPDLVCKEHSKKLKIFCQDPKCMKLICTHCAIENGHKLHTHKLVEKAAFYYRELVSEKVCTIKGLFERMKEESQRLKNSIDLLQKEKATAEKKIKDFMNKLRDEIENREKALLSELETESNKISSVLETPSVNLNKLIEFTNKYIILIEWQLSITPQNAITTNTFTFLSNTKLFLDQMDQITKIKWENSTASKYEITQSESTPTPFDNETLQPTYFFEFQAKGEQNIKDLILYSNKIINKKEEIKKEQNPIASITPLPIENETNGNFINNSEFLEDFNILSSDVAPTPTNIIGPELSSNFGQLKYPYYIAKIPQEWWQENVQNPKYDISGDVLVVTDHGQNRAVLINQQSAKVQLVIGTTKGNKPGQLSAPLGVTVMKCSNYPYIRIVVVDYGNNRIQAFDAATGKYLNHFTNDKYLKSPWSIAVIPKTGNLVVSNYSSNTITIHKGYSPFKNNDSKSNESDFGDVIKVIESSNELNINQPRGVAINSKNNIVLVSQNKVTVFDSLENGCKVLTSFGVQGSLKNGEFNFPFAVTTDFLDNIIVSDYGNNRIQFFKEDGSFFYSFGKLGNRESEFYFPCGILVDNTSGAIVVVDTYNHRIQIF